MPMAGPKTRTTAKSECSMPSRLPFISSGTTDVVCAVMVVMSKNWYRASPIFQMMKGNLFDDPRQQENEQMHTGASIQY